jgi:hypothetical protein
MFWNRSYSSLPRQAKRLGGQRMKKTEKNFHHSSTIRVDNTVDKSVDFVRR